MVRGFEGNVVLLILNNDGWIETMPVKSMVSSSFEDIGNKSLFHFAPLR
jgi:hypothetical protein